MARCKLLNINNSKKKCYAADFTVVIIREQCTLMKNSTSKLQVLSIFSLVMITVGSVDSIRNLPATALFGSSLIFFFTMAAIFFLIPSALVSAELSAAWPEQGGVYVWVKEAFGERFGFIAIWFQWIENVIWYPTILSFVAGTLGYLISPSLAHSKIFLIVVILCAFWGATIVNLFGMKHSARFGNFCAVSGLLLPMTLIIALGTAWIVSGHPLQISFRPDDLLPNLRNPQIWVALTGIMMSFCGMEIATVHAREVKDPQTAFPKALIISTIILLVTLIFGSLAIAIVLPEANISLVAGIMQSFDLFFTNYHMHWIMPIIAIMLVIGGMGSVSNWIVAPTKGLLVAAQDGHLPKHLSLENKYHAPAALLYYQAIIVTILMGVFLLMPSVNGSYWLLTALAAQLYMFMYLLMFLAGIYLRYKHPKQIRPFKVRGMWLVAGAGIIGSLLTVVIGFIPPSNINIGSTLRYEILLIIGLVLMTLPPFIIYHARKRRREKTFVE